MGEVRRNINLRLPAKARVTDYHSTQISPYTDRLVEELSSGRESRMESRKKTQVQEAETGGDAGERSKRRLEDRPRQAETLLQERALKIETLELSVRSLRHQIDRLSEEKYLLHREELSKANLQLATKAKSAFSQLADAKEIIESIRKLHNPEVVEAVDKYAKFFLHRIEDVPRLFQVFIDRGQTVRSFGDAVGERDFAGALLAALQTMCDFIVAEGERERLLTEKGVQTAQRTSLQTEEIKVHAKPEQGYMKVIDQSDQLLASISAQSQRIANLNSQLYSSISQQQIGRHAKLMDHYRAGQRKEQGKAYIDTSGKSSPTGSQKVAKLEDWEDVSWKRMSPRPT